MVNADCTVWVVWVGRQGGGGGGGEEETEEGFVAYVAHHQHVSDCCNLTKVLNTGMHTHLLRRLLHTSRAYNYMSLFVATSVPSNLVCVCSS